MTTTPTRWEHDVQALFDLLSEEPFEGTAWDLAKACGMTFEQCRNALHRIRSAAWIDEYHWTIPYVTRGSDTNIWRIVDTTDHADNLSMRDSQNRRADEMRHTTVRNIAQAELALAAVDGRTAAGRHWANVLLALRAANAHLDLILEDAAA